MDETTPQENRRRRFVVRWADTKTEVYATHFKTSATGELFFFDGNLAQCAVFPKGKWDSVVAEP